LLLEELDELLVVVPTVDTVLSLVEEVLALLELFEGVVAMNVPRSNG
jgi:hypothetical protein